MLVLDSRSTLYTIDAHFPRLLGFDFVTLNSITDSLHGPTRTFMDASSAFHFAVEIRSMDMIDTTLVKTVLQGRSVVAHLKTGNITDFEKDSLSKELTAVAAAHGFRLVLDMAEVVMVGSSGLGMFLAMQKQANAAKGKLVLCNLSEDLIGMLKITSLDKLLTRAKDVDAALKLIG